MSSNPDFQRRLSTHGLFTPNHSSNIQELETSDGTPLKTSMTLENPHVQ